MCQTAPDNLQSGHQASKFPAVQMKVLVINLMLVVI